MTHDVVLAVHVAAGVLGVVLGPLVVWRAYRRRVGRLAAGYHGAVAAVCISALGLAALDVARLWWLLPISLGTYALVLRGVLAGRGHRPGWAASAVRGYGGAYIALWTAIVVVSAGSSVLTWLLPAILGTPVVELLAARAHREPAMINAGD
ncbi:MAG: hypothetical protein M3455_00040 [Actinomycetota bacterium]|jgi:hypothetical protein|nr:hypothetical protein [Sporichthyaceae bacterium]MDQ3449311.1 hypothetical protein [Actinomycetota bacterium]